MADKPSYPQIPSTVWWGVRSLLQRSPNATINERTLGIDLDVQETAARQYLSELKRAGILDEDSRPTPLAQKWRHDDTYADAVQEILALVYPAELMQVAPPEAGNRQKVISWFTRAGLGVGTAGNKAATYMLLGSESPNEPPTRGAANSQKGVARTPQGSKRTTISTAQPSSSRGNPAPEKQAVQTGLIPLNVNVQIHISAEASSEQIESIFSAMRRYLYDGTTA